MRSKHRHRYQQLEFHDHHGPTPTWKGLPAQAQQRTLLLIAQLLREAYSGSANIVASEKGQRDE